MPTRHCLVLIPAEVGSGHHTYDLGANSSLEAAARGLRKHGAARDDDAIISVILDGKSLLLWDAHEHNAQQPTFRHRVSAVRRWLHVAEWRAIIELFANVGIAVLPNAS